MLPGPADRRLPPISPGLLLLRMHPHGAVERIAGASAAPIVTRSVTKSLASVSKLRQADSAYLTGVRSYCGQCILATFRLRGRVVRPLLGRLNRGRFERIVTVQHDGDQPRCLAVLDTMRPAAGRKRDGGTGCPISMAI